MASTVLPEIHLCVKLHPFMSRRTTELVLEICLLPESPLLVLFLIDNPQAPRKVLFIKQNFRQRQKFQTIYAKYFCLFFFLKKKQTDIEAQDSRLFLGEV